MKNYLEKYNKWINSSFIDKDTKEELLKIKDDEKEIEDRFYKDLEFGTAGLRGVVGNGTNRMNKYTVGKASQGLANYILKNNITNKPVIISYDSRHFSKEFSDITALCLNANGIKTYIFEELKPVPELSFAVRKLNAIAGIMITASHNPPEYNGYKVYGEDGSQIVEPLATNLIFEVNAVNFEDIKLLEKTDAINKGLYNLISEDLEEAYIKELENLVLNKEIIKTEEKNLKIVYSPLHGAGNIPVQKILKKLGFSNVFIAPEQEEPNGDFPTVKYPNPESKEAFSLALNLAKEVDADIVLATDPDADRLGIYAKDTKTNEYIPFTGNMSALLIAEYRLSILRKRKLLPKNGAIVKSIVSSNLADDIAAYYNLKLIDVLTGFKYVGEQIKLFEENNSYTFLFGFEESYGCLFGTYARDKDGVAAVMALCEAASYYKHHDMSLPLQMENIYKKYGYFIEETISIEKKGISGLEEIKNIMDNLRENPPRTFGKEKIIENIDYLGKTSLPKSNVLYYVLPNNSWVAVRPSGTEPKIKIYIGIKEETKEKAIKKINNIKENILEIIN